MRRGRPTQHTKAKWITYTSDGTEKFYELDEKGRLIKKGLNLSPHHEAAFPIDYKAPPIPVIAKPPQASIPKVILPFFNMVTYQMFPSKSQEQAPSKPSSVPIQEVANLGLDVKNLLV